MAEAVVTVAVETIRDLLVEEGKFLLGVKDQFEGLRGELEALGSFLKDASARKHEDESVLTWVRQATRLAYRAEDIIEEYAIKVASKRGGGFRKFAKSVGGIMREGTAIHEVGNEIGKIKTEIANLITRLEGYGINRIIQTQPSPATREKQRQRRVRYAHEEDEYFVGMEDDVSKIVAWVTEDDKIRRVISICGIGGLGKTTIARKVFNHRKVQRSFECFAWVSITQQCQVQLILHNILIQILGDDGRDNLRDTKEDQKIVGNEGLDKGDKLRDMKEEELVPMLYDVLKNKKCFLVLDDIWNMDDWESLRPAFPISKGSSKILLTTRTTEVAKVAHRQSQHEPSLLDEKDGWNLLIKIAFNPQEHQGNTLPVAVENVGRDMLRKCGGLPLAISVLGGILIDKDSVIEWETVNNQFGTHMSRNGVLSVLALSYDDLPSYLRSCFLYMGCFREDEKIDVVHLYHLWMAEGLISSSKLGPGETLMDTASGILEELISRHMVQPQVRNVLTDKKYCRLHDLVRELCLTKAKEEQFLEVKSKPFLEDGEAWVVSYDDRDLCRQSILADNIGLVWRVSIEISSHDTYIKALMINCPLGPKIIGPHGLKFVGQRFNFRRLRSLVLDGCYFKDDKLPKEMRDMIHLRYLSLEDTLDHGKLPAFIGDLQYLQTLNLANNYGLQLPNIFHKMKRLRYLYLPYGRRKLRNGKLKFPNELEVMEDFDSECDEFTHLSEFVNLRRFSAAIKGCENLSTILVHLSSLLKLQYISIQFNTEGFLVPEFEKSFTDVKKLLLCRYLHDLELCGPIGKFPKYEPQFCQDLVSLVLYNTEIEEDPMPFLQELPNLRDLALETFAYAGKEMYCSSKAFPKLTSLKIGLLSNIEIWRVDAGAFPNLSTLRIGDHFGGSNSFEIVPNGLTNITSLTRINLDDMPKEFRNKYGRLQNTNH